MNPAAVGFQCPSCVRQGAATIRQPTGHFGGRIQTGSPVTYALIAINVAVFLLTAAGQQLTSANINSPMIERLVLFAGHGGSGLFPGYGVAGGQYYRLLTSCFVHFGVLHIGSNMLVLYFVGPSLERVLGWWRFAAVYLISGLGGSVATYLIANPNSAEAGASGAIFGLFAAYLVIGRHLRADLSGMISTIVLNLFLTFSIPGISITGHLGGLAVGAIAGVVITRSKRRTELQIGGFVVVLVVLVVLTVLRTSSLS
jgi:membrane associated rhomboid family serine protease